MDYPITREALQSIVEAAEAAATAERFRELIEHLKLQIIVAAYRDQKKASPNRPIAIDAFGAAGPSRKPGTLVFKLPLYYIRSSVSLVTNAVESKPPSCSDVIVELSKAFPGVTFAVDPLQSYLYVDWS